MVLDRDDVDTDQIIPAEYCKRLTKSGYGDALFAHWRTDARFVLNDPRRASASVLIASANFGTGSSREHAVWALRDWGFAAVIAASFGDIFLRNAWRNGLLAVALPTAAVARIAVQAGSEPGFAVTVDLETCSVRAGADQWPFEADERARWLCLQGLDEIAVTLTADDAISGFERRRQAWLPRLHPGAVVQLAPTTPARSTS
jgi:3-isopropylmalate/(R)-2-methylmalate dehydratase small subunit